MHNPKDMKKCIEDMDVLVTRMIDGISDEEFERDQGLFYNLFKLRAMARATNKSLSLYTEENK